LAPPLALLLLLSSALLHRLLQYMQPQTRVRLCHPRCNLQPCHAAIKPHAAVLDCWGNCQAVEHHRNCAQVACKQLESPLLSVIGLLLLLLLLLLSIRQCCTLPPLLLPLLLLPLLLCCLQPVWLQRWQHC
jgi:hypothetical protein